MDLTAVRTFVAVVEAGQFQEAAAELSVTQQAVSKRVGALERDLGVRLFTRTPRGVTLTVDGQAFLPAARDLLAAAARATAAVRDRALRVDVLGTRLAPAVLLQNFHRAHPALSLDVVTLYDEKAAAAAVRAGSVDTSFRAVTGVHAGLTAARVHDEPLELLTGPAHPLAGRSSVTLAELRPYPIWMPSLVVPGTEWAAYYLALGKAFDLTIDVHGPDFGAESLLDELAEHPTLATFVGGQTRLTWPASYGLSRMAIEDPTPVYPHSLLWREDNAHPTLAALRAFFAGGPTRTDTWTPEWTR